MPAISAWTPPSGVSPEKIAKLDRTIPGVGETYARARQENSPRSSAPRPAATDGRRDSTRWQSTRSTWRSPTTRGSSSIMAARPPGGGERKVRRSMTGRSRTNRRHRPDAWSRWAAGRRGLTLDDEDRPAIRVADKTADRTQARRDAAAANERRPPTSGCRPPSAASPARPTPGADPPAAPPEPTVTRTAGGANLSRRKTCFAAACRPCSTRSSASAYCCSRRSSSGRHTPSRRATARRSSRRTSSANAAP